MYQSLNLTFPPFFLLHKYLQCHLLTMATKYRLDVNGPRRTKQRQEMQCHRFSMYNVLALELVGVAINCNSNSKSHPITQRLSEMLVAFFFDCFCPCHRMASFQRVSDYIRQFVRNTALDVRFYIESHWLANVISFRLAMSDLFGQQKTFRQSEFHQFIHFDKRLVSIASFFSSSSDGQNCIEQNPFVRCAY